MTTNYHTYYIIFLISFALRLLISFVYGDHSLQNEWEILVRNLIEHNTLAMINFGDLYVPNLWMPPLYAYFLFSISIFFESLNNTYINTVLITQCLLSSITRLLKWRIRVAREYPLIFGGRRWNSHFLRINKNNGIL